MRVSEIGEFRTAAGRFASGVTVVTVHGAAGLYGLTASSFASLSLNPLLVSVSINRASPLLGFARETGAYAVSVLSSGQQGVAGYFARRGREPEPGAFAAVSTRTEVTGAPVIDGALSWFDCRLEDILPGGDHEILIGRVAAAGGGTGEPLVYWGGDYRALTPSGTTTGQLANAADGLAVALHLLEVEAAEMLDAQQAIEPHLAGLAAARGKDVDWDRLLDLIEQSDAVVDEPEAFNISALAFHAGIAEIAGNRMLQAALASLGLIQSSHFADRGSPASARAAVAGHRTLLMVLRSGDAANARAEMSRHLSAVRDQLHIG